MQLALGHNCAGARARLAVYKCNVAAALAGVPLQAVKASGADLALPSRLPSLLAKPGLVVFGEHAICRYLARAGAQPLAPESLEASEWVDLDDGELAASFPASSSSFSFPVGRVESKMPAAGQQYLASPTLSVADVCLGCTLALAKSGGAALGPKTESWLGNLVAKHPEFGAGLAKTDADIEATAGYVSRAWQQQSPLTRIMEEACDAAVAQECAGAKSAVADGSKFSNDGVPPEFQLNSAMALFKRAPREAWKSPRDVAETLERNIRADASIFPGIVASTKIMGPGFINLCLSDTFVSARVLAVVEAGRLLPPRAAPRKVGLDFSSPNVAKEMHVGHLRSTIIGEVLCRVLSFTGHEVHRINHIGDWGTQFGMLLLFMKQNHPDFLTNPPSLADLNEFYKAAKQAFDASEDFKTEARAEVVKLQSGDEGALAGWRQFVGVSLAMLGRVYTRLGVTFPDGMTGESFYNSRIPAVVAELEGKGLVEPYEGAKVLETKAAHLFVQKSDGGYGYDSTDLAAIKYRVSELERDWLIYVTDSGQRTHFLGIFEAAERAGWVDPARVRVDHVGHGVVNDKSGRKFKTREGGTVRLVDLLDEAKKRMETDLRARIDAGRCLLRPEEVDEAAGKIGYSAVKYFDLKNTREKDYIFDYDAMLQSDGDTAVYLIYSYARICSIERKILEVVGRSADDIIEENKPSFTVSRERPSEWETAIALLRFQDRVETMNATLQPHHLTKYVMDLSSTFTKFYAKNQMLLVSENKLADEHGANWLTLTRAVKIALRDSMQLLNLDVLERI